MLSLRFPHDKSSSAILDFLQACSLFGQWPFENGIAVVQSRGYHGGNMYCTKTQNCPNAADTR